MIHSYFEKLFLGYFDVYTGAHEATEPNFGRFQYSARSAPADNGEKKLKKLMLVVTASFAGEK